MAFTTRIVRDHNYNENDNSIATYERHAEHVWFAVSSTTLVVTDIRQLRADLHAQHQLDKKTLTDLNERFRLFVDHVYKLELKNSKYIEQLADYRLQASGISFTDVQQWSERYAFLYTDLTAVSNAKIDYQFDFELYQLQTGIYQLLMHVAHGKDERYLKLEQELKQSTSTLHALRVSYAELERETESLYVAREDKFKQCLRLAHDWCNVTKQRKKWELNVQILKSQVVFYKNLRSYSERFEAVVIESVDATQFWSVELEKCVKKIRRDFELLYATIYHQMTAYYETKTVEMQKDAEQAVYYHRIEMEELMVSQQTLQVEYEEVQKSWSDQNQIRIDLEATISKLESELKSIQSQQEQRFVAQSNELHNAQESTMTKSYTIEEIRRSTKSLEIEIIVYRHILESCDMKEEVVHISQSHSTAVEVTEKLVVENESKRNGSVGIKECAASGRYISLVNHSTSKDIDISRWMLKRRIDAASEVLYTLPDGVRLHYGKELTIYSKLGADAVKLSSDSRATSSSAHQELVIDSVSSWGMGSTIKTLLLNQNGEEEASHTQTIVFGRNNMR